MPQTFALSSTNDLVINPTNGLTVLTGIDAVAAACNTAAQTQLGECVLVTGQGLPNFQAIWVGVPDFGIWQTYLEKTLLNVQGVATVENIDLSQNDGVLNYVARITTVYGPVTIQGALNG